MTSVLNTQRSDLRALSCAELNYDEFTALKRRWADAQPGLVSDCIDGRLICVLLLVPLSRCVVRESAFRGARCSRPYPACLRCLGLLVLLSGLGLRRMSPLKTLACV
jgi:hypothetical protein